MAVALSSVLNQMTSPLLYCWDEDFKIPEGSIVHGSHQTKYESDGTGLMEFSPYSEEPMPFVIHARGFIPSGVEMAEFFDSSGVFSEPPLTFLVKDTVVYDEPKLENVQAAYECPVTVHTEPP